MNCYSLWSLGDYFAQWLTVDGTLLVFDVLAFRLLSRLFSFGLLARLCRRLGNSFLSILVQFLISRE